MICRVCGKENEPTFRYCVNCGAELELKKQPDRTKCVACGASMRPNAAFCGTCGARQPVPGTPGKPKPAPEPVAEVKRADEPKPIHEPKYEPKREPKRESVLMILIAVLLGLCILCAGAAVVGDYFGVIDLGIWHKDDSSADTESFEEEYDDPGYSNEETYGQEPGGTEQEPFEKQVITVKANGSRATLTLSEWNDGVWSDVLNIPAYIGKNGITRMKTEGDRCTPAGTFRILYYLGTEKVPESKLSFWEIYPGDVWVSDPDSVYYNTLQSGGAAADWDKSLAENMYIKFTRGNSVACIMFDYNGDGISPGATNGGSDIFIDGVGANGDIDSGYGDIKISAQDMYTLLYKLDSRMNPIITIE